MGDSIRVGTAGWSYKDWNGVVYPEPRGKNFDALSFMAQYFDTIEINSTFYRPPTPKTATGWARRVKFNPDFRFSLKLHQKFTHERESLTEQDVFAFKSGIDPLVEAGLLGCILLQFPWSFKNNPENRRYLEELLKIFADFPRTLEIRHASWDNAQVYKFLQDEGVGFCNIDQPIFRDSLKPTERYTSTTGYVRLHGQNYRDWFRKEAGRDERYNYLYSREELAPWVDKIAKISGKAEQTFVITNNHFRGQAACNALQLKSLICGGKVKVPPALLKAFPQLREIVSEEDGEERSEPQGRLL